MSKAFTKTFEIPAGSSWQETSRLGKKWLDTHGMTPYSMRHDDKTVEFRGVITNVPATSREGIITWK